MLAFGVVAVAMAALVFVSPLVSLMGHLPFFGNVRWVRALGPMSFALAVLAGVGLDVLVRSFSTRAVRVSAMAAFPAPASRCWRCGCSVGDSSAGPGRPAGEELRLAPRRHRGGARARGRASDAPGAGRAAPWPFRIGSDAERFVPWRCCCACETTFLVLAGTPLWSSSPHSFAPTPGTVALERAVGSSVVGAGVLSCFGAPGPKVGILPNANLAYGVHEFAVYDPLTPRTYKASWFAASGQSAGLPRPFRLRECFVPAVTTAQLGRLYGVEFVLEPPGAPGPRGAVFRRADRR